MNRSKQTPSSLIENPRRLTIFALITLLVVYASWLTYTILADRPLDFYVYYLASETVARGNSPYTITDANWDALASELGISNYTRPYRYPPQVAVLLLLFRSLGPRGTMALWEIANAVAMIAGVWLIGKSLGHDRWVPFALIVLLVSIPPFATLLAGQVNGLLFLSLALALWALVNRRTTWLGFALAMGTILKVIPLALILYLFWRKQWRAGLIASGILVVLTVACLPVMGWQALSDYAFKAILLGEPNEVSTTATNQTLTAVLGRMFPFAPSFALDGGRWLGLGLVILTAILCVPIGDAQRLMPLEFALIVTALQLIPPFTWYHQLVLLLIPLLIVMQELWNKKKLGWLSGLAILFVLFDLHGVAWHTLEQWWFLSSFPFLFGITLWGLLAWFIMKDKRQYVAV